MKMWTEDVRYTQIKVLLSFTVRNVQMMNGLPLFQSAVRLNALTSSKSHFLSHCMMKENIFSWSGSLRSLRKLKSCLLQLSVDLSLHARWSVTAYMWSNKWFYEVIYQSQTSNGLAWNVQWHFKQFVQPKKELVCFFFFFCQVGSSR